MRQWRSAFSDPSASRSSPSNAMSRMGSGGSVSVMRHDRRGKGLGLVERQLPCQERDDLVIAGFRAADELVHARRRDRRGKEKCDETKGNGNSSGTAREHGTDLPPGEALSQAEAP